MSLGRKSFVMAVGLVVACFIVVSFWLCVISYRDKVQLVRGTSQIVDMVDMVRRTFGSEIHAGGPREDAIARLARMGQISGTVTIDGMQSLDNAWGGALLAFTTPEGFLRIETSLPSRNCVRVLHLLQSDVTSLGLNEIDVRAHNETWRQLYVDHDHGALSQSEIAAGCRSPGSVTLALIFVLK